MAGEHKPRLTRELVAMRVAQELSPGSTVNLGVGMPTLVAAFAPPDANILLQSENRSTSRRLSARFATDISRSLPPWPIAPGLAGPQAPDRSMRPAPKTRQRLAPAAHSAGKLRAIGPTACDAKEAESGGRNG